MRLTIFDLEGYRRLSLIFIEEPFEFPTQLSTASTKAIIAQISSEYPKQLQGLTGNQDRVSQLKAGLRSFSDISLERVDKDFFSQMEQQTDRFNRWHQFSTAFANMFNVALGNIGQ